METLKHSTGNNSGEQLTLLQEDSLVSHSAHQESGKVQRMTVTSGQKCLESFERLSRSTSWGRMFMASLIGQKGWYSNRCKLIWRLKATRSHRLYFQLVPSMLPIEEIGFGLLPTPRKVEFIEHPEKVAARLGDRTGNAMNNISSMAAFGLLPTPTANTAPYQYSNGDKSRPVTPTLVGLMNAGLLPTPQGFDGFKASIGMNQRSITRTVKEFHGKGSLLSHRYVMEMMGYPPDWCDLQLKPEETQSFRKSRSKSLKQ